MSEYTFTLKNLPENVKDILLQTYAVKNIDEHRKNRKNKSQKNSSTDLFAMLEADVPGEEFDEDLQVEIDSSQIIWATDNYENKGEGYGFLDPVNDLSIIVPRVDKSKAEQKRRSKEKAEVFTPSWVCNVQNNLIDENVLYEGVFNTTVDDGRKWVPSSEKVKFNKEYSWLDYVVERRIEFTCGESPYLMSPYDTTTGEGIPVRDEEGRFARIGLLDRKLRVISENVKKDEWDNYALLALIHTFGYEWQGDNLLLARLNFINTFIEYRMDAVGEMPDDELLSDVAEIAAWNIWQMDGLKMVEPMTCSDDCQACKKKKRAGHNGKVSAIRFLGSKGFVQRAFEDMLPDEMFV